MIGVASRTTPPVQGDAFEAWVAHGVELGIEPSIPLAEAVATIASAHVSSGALGDASARPSFTIVPFAPFELTGEARILVLRV
jgi:hypothetical protein